MQQRSNEISADLSKRAKARILSLDPDAVITKEKLGETMILIQQEAKIG